MNTAKTNLKKYVSNLNESHQSKNISKIKFWAHSIKGTAISLHCPILAAYGRELESRVINDELEGMEDLIEKINTEVHILINDHFKSD